MDDWDGLRFFLAVAEAGSLSAAARRLRVSQPTVGRRVAALEAAMQTRLFDRSSRRLTPTPAAEGLLEAARRMAQEADGATRRLSGRDLSLSGPVRLSCTEGLGARWLPARLRRMRDELPGLELELVVDNAAVNLSRREADLALRIRDPARAAADGQALVGRRLGRLAFALYASRGYLAQRSAPKRAAELAEHDVVAPPETLRVAPHFDWFDRLAGPARRVFRSNSLVALHEAARAGWGIAMLAAVHGEADPELVRVLADEPAPAAELWILYHADLKRNARVRAVADLVAEIVRREPALLEREPATRP